MQQIGNFFFGRSRNLYVCTRHHQDQIGHGNFFFGRSGKLHKCTRQQNRFASDQAPYTWGTLGEIRIKTVLHPNAPPYKAIYYKHYRVIPYLTFKYAFSSSRESRASSAAVCECLVAVACQRLISIDINTTVLGIPTLHITTDGGLVSVFLSRLRIIG